MSTTPPSPTHSADTGATTVTCPNCGARNRIHNQPHGVPRCARCQTSLPWIIDATAEIFDAARQASVPVLVDFWAPWCGPCRMVSPAVATLAVEFAGRLKVVKLDIDTAPGIARRYEVQGIPLLVLFRDGGEVDRQVGAVPLPQLREWLRGVVYEKSDLS